MWPEACPIIAEGTGLCPALTQLDASVLNNSLFSLYNRRFLGQNGIASLEPGVFASLSSLYTL